MISSFFIKRPILAAVISIIIFLSGIASIRSLPVSQYPNILPVEITVATTYFGANAEMLAETVSAPLEAKINGAPGMLYMTSTSSNNGQLTITVTFSTETDPAQAEIDVNNRIQSALASLPQEVRNYGIVVSRRSSSLLEVITLSSDSENYTPLFLSNYATLYMIDNLKRVSGVGDASLFGASDYSMRIWIHPDKMAVHEISTSDIAYAIRTQNSQFAIGNLAQPPNDPHLQFSYSLNTQGRFHSVGEFEQIILRTNEDGSTLRLKDVANVELGAQDYSFKSLLNGDTSVSIGIYLEVGANALNTATAVNKAMEEIAKSLPPGVKYSIPFDTTKFIQVSIKEVVKTFAEAILLVTLIVYLFLQNGRATLIPLLAVPVSLIGTFSGMYALGFSINLMTLFGLVLAIGIVVDDAIVVIENVERIMESENLSSVDATIKAMEEVTGPIVAIVLVLCSVFMPVAFIGGLAGTIYKQFAVTIAISVVISGVVALTLTPALCAIFIQHKQNNQPNIFFQKFNEAFHYITEKYTQGVSWILGSQLLGIIVFVITITITVILFKQIPSGLVPEEDQGYIFNIVNLPPGSSLTRTENTMKKASAMFLSDESVKYVISLIGLDFLGGGLKTHTGASFIILKDWDERDSKTQDSLSMIQKFSAMAGKFKEAILILFNSPPIVGMSRTGGFEMYLQYRGKDSPVKNLQTMTDKLILAASSRPELAPVRTTLSVQTPQYDFELDRVKASALNINIAEVFATMQATFGILYVNDFSLYSRTYRTLMQADSQYRQKPEDLSKIFVRSNDNHMVPLSNLFSVQKKVGVSALDRFNIFPAAKLLGGPKPGYSSGQAINAMEQVAAETLSSEFTLSPVGSAYQEKIARSSGSTSLIFGLIAIFLILAALYEKWFLPIAVLASIPFAILGAVIFVKLRGLSNDVYFQVGILTLIGLSAKNAILIVEFAILKMQQGKNVLEASIEAAQLRLRPIIMTSLAFILGCVPLFISTGAGASSRHSIATGVIGGMLFSTFIAVFFTPLFFKMVIDITNRFKRS